MQQRGGKNNDDEQEVKNNNVIGESETIAGKRVFQKVRDIRWKEGRSSDDGVVKESNCRELLIGRPATGTVYSPEREQSINIFAVNRRKDRTAAKTRNLAVFSS